MPYNDFLKFHKEDKKTIDRIRRSKKLFEILHIIMFNQDSTIQNISKLAKSKYDITNKKIRILRKFNFLSSKNLRERRKSRPEITLSVNSIKLASMIYEEIRNPNSYVNDSFSRFIKIYNRKKKTGIYRENFVLSKASNNRKLCIKHLKCIIDLYIEKKWYFDKKYKPKTISQFLDVIGFLYILLFLNNLHKWGLVDLNNLHKRSFVNLKSFDKFFIKNKIESNYELLEDSIIKLGWGFVMRFNIKTPDMRTLNELVEDYHKN